MRKTMLILLIASFGFISSGCVTYIALGHRSHAAPAYCYDCHSQPRWVKVYTNCNYYVIKTAGDGYYYKPRNVKHVKFAHRDYDRKIVRERQTRHAEYMKSHNQKNNLKRDDNRPKDKKPRRG